MRRRSRTLERMNSESGRSCYLKSAERFYHKPGQIVNFTDFLKDSPFPPVVTYEALFFVQTEIGAQNNNHEQLGKNMENDNAASNSNAGATNQAVTINKAHLISICAVGLLICFFLPWIDVIIAKPSGMDFQKESEAAKLLWLMPILSALTIFAGMAGKSAKIASQLAGLTPFVILAYGRLHEEQLFHVLGVGAYIALILGFFLIVLPHSQK